MKKIYIFLFCLFIIDFTYAQVQCFEPRMQKGINDYNAHNYKEAKEHFQDASCCADKPSEGDKQIEDWIRKCEEKVLPKATTITTINEKKEPSLLKVSPTTVTFEAAEGESYFSVSCNGDFIISSLPDWLIINKDSTGFTLFYKANGRPIERSWNFIVSAGEEIEKVSITQLGVQPLPISSEILSKEKDKSTIFVGADFAGDLPFQYTTNFLGDFYFGMAKKIGWYVKIKTNFDFNAFFDYPNIEDNIENYLYAESIEFSDASRFGVLGGAIFHIAQPLFFKIGVGYGIHSEIYRLNENGFSRKYFWDKFNSIDIEAMIMLRIWIFTFQVGASCLPIRVGKPIIEGSRKAYFEFSLGAGVAFGDLD